MTRAELQADLARRLGSNVEARWIVEELLDPSTPRLPGSACGMTVEVPPDLCAAADVLARRRMDGEPLQYLLGHWAFRSLDLLVDPRVLIPRPETEQVVEVALAELHRLFPPAIAGTAAQPAALPAAAQPAALPAAAQPEGPVVVDLGTGSGAIALSMATEAHALYPGVSVWATDASADALEVADDNRRRVGVGDPGAAERVRLRLGSWWAALPPELEGSIHLVIANPPYVAEEEWPDLEQPVKAEPYGALVASDGRDGTPGLADIEAIIGGASQWLATPASLVVEIAPHQAAAAIDCARKAGFSEASVEPDLTGRPRALVARQ